MHEHDHPDLLKVSPAIPDTPQLEELRSLQETVAAQLERLLPEGPEKDLAFEVFGYWMNITKSALARLAIQPESN